MRRDRPTSKPRPAWLLAVGTAKPADELTIGQEEFRLIETLKVDAFALTARYRAVGRDADAVVKRCRTQPAFGVPFAWLGRRLARRERFFHGRLAQVAGVPADLGDVWIGGLAQPSAFARAWVPGAPLLRTDSPGAGFFDRAEALVDAAHQLGVALVDLDKVDNFIVDEHGAPHLLDFQLAFCVDRRGWLPRRLAERVLRTQQRCDRYHMLKHRLRQQPETVPGGRAELDRLRPGWIRQWGRVWRPVILARRRLFVVLGVRRGDGTAATEAVPGGQSSYQ